jgi:peptidoglycan hydrolase-like protein with peptidoglycan-binding domain
MKPFATLATGTLLATLLSAPAIGQPAAPLADIQPVPPGETLRPSSVRAVQQRLQTMGFYRGATDGVWGLNTQTAIEQFQQSRGLQPTGQLTPATIAAMGLSPVSLTYPPITMCCWASFAAS